jgi:hypothetical protein
MFPATSLLEESGRNELDSESLSLAPNYFAGCFDVFTEKWVLESHNELIPGFESADGFHIGPAKA